MNTVPPFTTARSGRIFGVAALGYAHLHPDAELKMFTFTGGTRSLSVPDGEVVCRINPSLVWCEVDPELEDAYNQIRDYIQMIDADVKQ